MSRLRQLRSATSFSDVANLLKIKPSHLAYVLYRLPPTSKYRSFNIPKKSGGTRLIQAPESRLRRIQSELRKLLNDCYEELMSSRGIVEQCTISHGFRKGFSIYTNAKLHRHRRYVFNTDIKDFFGSINFGRVRGFFLKSHDFSLHPRVATTIAQIACHDNKLPQGAPTSPVISNLIANILDMRLNKIATKHRCTYSRYADDLTFSTNRRSFPAGLARHVRDDDGTWKAGKELVSCLKDASLPINSKKSRMQLRASRQVVTGLVTNEKLNIKSEYLRKTRAMCDHLMRRGAAFDSVGAAKRPITLENIRGRLSFIYMTKTYGIERKRLSRNRTAPSYYRLYYEFLDFVTFYSTDKPLLLCEGDTDNIYLKCAIEALSSDFPHLIDRRKTAPQNLNVSIFNYSKISADVQHLGGGAGDLANLIRTYTARLAGFTAPTRRRPVILIVDDDTGGRCVFQAVKEVQGSPVTTKYPFIHVTQNLYVVPIPIVTGASSQIEDLFDKRLLSSKLDGKAFSPEANFDSSKFFGKRVFAEKVVKPNRSTIDYEGFKPLLLAITKAIADFEARAIKRAA